MSSENKRPPQLEQAEDKMCECMQSLDGSDSSGPGEDCARWMTVSWLSGHAQLHCGRHPGSTLLPWA